MTDFSYKPTLTGELVILRPLTEDDYPAMRIAFDDAEVIRLTGSHTAISDERAREWLRTRKDLTASATRCTGKASGWTPR
jgi:hypothetical protein